jgi:hypothetical protein
MAEELLKILFKGGLKLFSNTIKVMGGPGVFEFSTISGVLAFIIALAFDALVDIGDQLAIGETAKKIAEFAKDSHMYSTLGKGMKNSSKVLGVAGQHGTGAAAEAFMESLPFASTIIRVVSITTAASIGISQLMKYAENSKESNKLNTENLNNFTLSFNEFLLEGLNKKY